MEIFFPIVVAFSEKLINEIFTYFRVIHGHFHDWCPISCWYWRLSCPVAAFQALIEIVFVLKDPTNRKVSLNRPFSDPEKEKIMSTETIHQ